MPSTLSQDCKAAFVKEAYKKQSMLWHPDRVENEKKDVATQKFPIISKAYNIINDPAKKKFYDSTGLLDDDWDKVRRAKEDAQRRCITIFQQKMAQLK